MTTIDARMHELAERQHGLVAREQAVALGLHRSGWWRRVHGDHWELLGTGVARRRGAPPTDEQQALAAVLDAGSGAALVGPSAAAHWGIPGHRLRPLQVATSRRQVRSPLATLHLPRMDLAPHTVVLEGVPVVRPALLLLQLAAVVHPGRLRRHLDQLWSRRLLSAASVRSELSALMHRGRPGTAALRELLDALPADYVPPASGLESRFESILERHGLPAMRRQVDVGDQHRWTGRVDYLAHDLPVVAEVDSDRYHRALSSTEDDTARDRALADGGFVVARVTQFQVWHRPAEVVEAILTARREARDRVRAAA